MTISNLKRDDFFEDSKRFPQSSYNFANFRPLYSLNANLIIAPYYHHKADKFHVQSKNFFDNRSFGSFKSSLGIMVKFMRSAKIENKARSYSYRETFSQLNKDSLKFFSNLVKSSMQYYKPKNSSDTQLGVRNIPVNNESAAPR